VSPLAARLEALLFAAAEPVALAALAAAAGASEAEVSLALSELASHLDQEGHGFSLEAVAGGYQLLTRPEYGTAVTALLQRRRPPLSRAALETLAVVVFRQPVTRAEIDDLRGVRSDGALMTLVERGLVAEVGRDPGPGRPARYGTTRRFLEYFGLRDLSDLEAARASLERAARQAAAAADPDATQT
jgi:segregation and condensation protein B